MEGGAQEKLSAVRSKGDVESIVIALLMKDHNKEECPQCNELKEPSV